MPKSTKSPTRKSSSKLTTAERSRIAIDAAQGRAQKGQGAYPHPKFHYRLVSVNGNKKAPKGIKSGKSLLGRGPKNVASRVMTRVCNASGDPRECETKKTKVCVKNISRGVKGQGITRCYSGKRSLRRDDDVLKTTRDVVDKNGKKSTIEFYYDNKMNKISTTAAPKYSKTELMKRDLPTLKRMLTRRGYQGTKDIKSKKVAADLLHSDLRAASQDV